MLCNKERFRVYVTFIVPVFVNSHQRSTRVRVTTPHTHTHAQPEAIASLTKLLQSEPSTCFFGSLQGNSMPRNSAYFEHPQLLETTLPQFSLILTLPPTSKHYEDYCLLDCEIACIYQQRV